MSVPARVPPERPAPVTEQVLQHPVLWLLLVIFGFGCTTWAAFLYIGTRGRRRSWLVWAAVYGASLVIWLVMVNAFAADWATAIGAVAAIFAWLGGGVHAALILQDAARRRMPYDIARVDAARLRIDRRSEGRRMAVRDPRLAREVGVGRPDIPKADDFGLIDVNHAPPEVLCRLPGLTPDIAQRIVDVRKDVGLFKSAEDLSVTLDLSPDLLDDLREYSVFL